MLLLRRFVILLLIAQCSQLLLAGTIVGSKHDLSLTNFYGPMAGASNEVCVFCHTPHEANTSNGPLWNRRVSNTGVFQVYTSPTMDGSCAATPSPVSLACLSCHDGVGGGAVNSADTHALVNGSNNDGGTSTQNCYACHSGGVILPGEWFQVGPDLSDDHPISIDYSAVQLLDPDFNTPPDSQNGWSDIKLFGGRVECPSCHNPHDNTNVPFLRKSITASSLCYTCHKK